MHVADHPALDGACPGPELTIDAWIYPFNVTRGTIVAKDNRYGFGIANGSLVFTMVGTSANGQYISPPVIPPHQWSHVAVTLTPGPSNGFCSFYVNGVPISNHLTEPDFGNFPGDLRIGYDFQLSYFHGNIGELEIFRRALSHP